jgi:hypothetical protein
VLRAAFSPFLLVVCALVAGWGTQLGVCSGKTAKRLMSRGQGIPGKMKSAALEANDSTRKAHLLPAMRACALALLFTAGAHAAEAPHRNQPSTQPCSCTVTLPPGQPDIRGTDQSPLSVRVVEPIPSHEAPTDWSGRAVAIATGVLALVTASLAYFTLRLWRSTSQLVSGAEITAKRELRAYVAPILMSVRSGMMGLQPVVVITIKNFGQTPAYRLSVDAFVAFAQTFADVPALEEQHVVRGHLAPGAAHEAKVVGPFIIDEQLWAQLTADPPTRTLFVHGIIRYVDAFKQAHWTSFRQQAARGLVDLTSCGEGNDTDDDV